MIKMLIVGYVFAIRSERRLCSEIQVNLAYRWFCQPCLEGSIPDHSGFCRARHERFRESDALRHVFEGVVAKCITAGLVGGEGFSIDASLIKADVDKKKRLPGNQPIAWPQAGEASRAVREYLSALDAAHSKQRNHSSSIVSTSILQQIQFGIGRRLGTALFVNGRQIGLLAGCDNPQQLIRQRPLQRDCIVDRARKPNFPFLFSRQKHRHSLGMDRAHNIV
jgi:hypothetical protein